MLKFEYTQYGPLALGADVKLNGRPIAIKSLDIHSQVGELTEITITGNVSGIETCLDNLEREHITINGIVYVGMTPEEALEFTEQKSL